KQRGKPAFWWQAFPGRKLSLKDGLPDLAGDLDVNWGRAFAIDNDLDHLTSCHLWRRLSWLTEYWMVPKHNSDTIGVRRQAIGWEACVQALCTRRDEAYAECAR